jgi:hypothetical protein
MNPVALGSHVARIAGKASAVIALTAMISTALAPSLTVSANALARFAGMPRPVPMAAPGMATTTSTAATYSLGETTIRVRGTQHLYRFSDSMSAITNERRVDFGLGAIYGGSGDVDKVGDSSYLEFNSGPYESWWVGAKRTGASSVTRFSTPVELKFSARDYYGVRFYNDTNVRSRLSVTVDSATTYHADRKGSFSGRSFFFVTDGPLAGRWVSARTVNVVSQTSNDNTVSGTNPDPLATWKGVVLIYPETDVTYKRSDGSTYHLQATMSSSMKNLVLDTLSRFHRSVYNWSGGLAALDLDIVTVPHAITSLDTLGTYTYWVGPRSVEKDIDTYAPAGKYDSVFVIWEHKDSSDEKVPVGGWGLTLPPGSWANGAGYSSVITPSYEWWWTDATYPEEVFVHEWMHQVIYFHENAGRLTFDLHAGESYGYSKTNGTWKAWLSDVMQGKVWDGNEYIGVTPELWAIGTPRNP